MAGGLRDSLQINISETNGCYGSEKGSGRKSMAERKRPVGGAVGPAAARDFWARILGRLSAESE